MQTPTGFGWMAWTWQTALFWLMIASFILAMSIWERFHRGGNPHEERLDSQRRVATGYLFRCWLLLIFTCYGSLSLK